MKPYTKPSVRSAAKCLVEGCMRTEELANGRSAGGLCAGHRWRKKRGLPLDATPISDSLARRLTPRQMLEEAAVGLAEAEGPDIDGALRRLRYAAVRYANHHAAGQREPRAHELLEVAARGLAEVAAEDDGGYGRALERLCYFACLYTRALGARLTVDATREARS